MPMFCLGGSGGLDSAANGGSGGGGYPSPHNPGSGGGASGTQSLPAVTGPLSSKPVPREWCHVQYYELDTPVGEQFKAAREHRAILVDGLVITHMSSHIAHLCCKTANLTPECLVELSHLWNEVFRSVQSEAMCDMFLALSFYFIPIGFTFFRTLQTSMWLTD